MGVASCHYCAHCGSSDGAEPLPDNYHTGDESQRVKESSLLLFLAPEEVFSVRLPL